MVAQVLSSVTCVPYHSGVSQRSSGNLKVEEMSGRQEKTRPRLYVWFCFQFDGKYP